MRWISVKNELPKTEELVIVTVTDDSDDTSYTYSCAGWYTGYDNLWVVDNEPCHWVTHWMQIPDISDAESIVRCKDCKWWVSNLGECGYVWENQGRILNCANPDHFCGWGEKKSVDITMPIWQDKIVRCIDCKHWDGYYCKYNGEALEKRFMRFEDDYCSRGEKKDETD